MRYYELYESGNIKIKQLTQEIAKEVLKYKEILKLNKEFSFPEIQSLFHSLINVILILKEDRLSKEQEIAILKDLISIEVKLRKFYLEIIEEIKEIDDTHLLEKLNTLSLELFKFLEKLKNRDFKKLLLRRKDN